MTANSRIVGSFFIIVAGLGGCTEPVADAPTGDLSAEARGLPFPALLDDAGARRWSACRSSDHRAFDFWLGKWTIDAGGSFGGVSAITKELGGCAVMEAYQNGAGRSLNLYDRLRDRWTQFYIDNGSALLLRLGGGIVAGEMVLADEVRVTPSGLSLQSEITWTPLAGGAVRQRWLLSTDGGASYGVAFDGTYQPADPPLPPVTPSQLCQTGQPAFRRADFLLGGWNVHDAHGNKIGTSTIRSSAGGCLLEEDFAGAGGYAARAFLAYDRVTRTWYRQQGDTVGFVFEQAGTAGADTLTLTGDTLPGLTTRMTWSATSSTQLVQRWEVSLDGVQFFPIRTLTYRRQA